MPDFDFAPGDCTIAGFDIMCGANGTEAVAGCEFVGTVGVFKSEGNTCMVAGSTGNE